MRSLILAILFCAPLVSLRSHALPLDYYARLNRLHFMLTSKPLTVHDPNYANLMNLMVNGKERAAIDFMMAKPEFIGTVSRSWASRYLTAEKSSSIALNDSLAMVLGIIRDNRDFREIGTGNFNYGAIPRLGLEDPLTYSNDLFSRMDSSQYPLNEILQRVEPQWNDVTFKEAAGILTSRGWAETYYSAGTNRRGVVGALNVLLCKAPSSWKTPFLETEWIRRDVTRAPSGDARIFQQECRSCHAPMDALGGAFAYLNYTDHLSYASSVESKFNQNSEAYPDGHLTEDDQFLNLLTVREQLDFGWRGSVKGKGIHQFGEMITSAKAFSRCIAKRSLNYFCAKDLSLNDPVVDAYSTFFEDQDHYQIKEFFARVVASPECQ